MMHGIIRSLIAALLALHTVLGCCWHHAHRSQTSEMAEAIASSDGCGCDHAHRDGPTPHSGGQPHQGRHGCQGSACVFVASSKAERQTSARPFDVSPAVSLSVADHCVCCNAGQRPTYSPDALLPPVRLHLVCRVLLI
jgi:hypothetical protein